MSEYLTAILWYAFWPVLIYISYKFVLINLAHHTKMERLQELEAKCAEEPNLK